METTRLYGRDKRAWKSSIDRKLALSPSLSQPCSNASRLESPRGKCQGGRFVAAKRRELCDRGQPKKFQGDLARSIFTMVPVRELFLRLLIAWYNPLERIALEVFWPVRYFCNSRFLYEGIDPTRGRVRCIPPLWTDPFFFESTSN